MSFPVAVLDELADAEALLSEPFLTSWRDGELTRDELRAFATQYHQLVDAFPRMVGTVHSITEDAQVRRTLVELLASIEVRSPTPADLWLQTCAALGLFSDSVRRAKRTNPTEACLNDCFYLCSSSPATGLASIYTIARLQPPLYRMLRDALTGHYGFSSGPGLEFFENAAYRAEEHVSRLRTMLERMTVDEHHEREAVSAAEAVLRALRGMCGGVGAAL